MPPLPGSRRDFYWYHILDFFLFVLLTLRIESRALPLRSDNWELNKCSITELQPRLFFSPHFYSETGSPSIVLTVFQLTVSDHDLNFESSSRVTELFFFFLHLVIYWTLKITPVFYKPLCLSLLDIFFFLSTPSLYFLRQFCCVIQAGLDITFLLLQFLLLKWQGTGMRVMFEKKNIK